MCDTPTSWKTFGIQSLLWLVILSCHPGFCLERQLVGTGVSGSGEVFAASAFATLILTSDEDRASGSIRGTW